MGWQHGSVGKGAYHQAWQPKFHSEDPHNRHREQTSTSCPLISTHANTQINKHDFKENERWRNEFGSHFLPLQCSQQPRLQPLCCVEIHFLSHRCGLLTTVDQSESISFRYTMKTKIPDLVWSICWKCGKPGKEQRVHEARNGRSRKTYPSSMHQRPEDTGYRSPSPRCPLPLSYTSFCHLLKNITEEHTRAFPP